MKIKVRTQELIIEADTNLELAFFKHLFSGDVEVIPIKNGENETTAFMISPQ